MINRVLRIKYFYFNSSFRAKPFRAASRQLGGAAYICFPECFLQGYLLEREKAQLHALDLGSPEFEQVLARLPASGPVLVIGMIEKDHGRLFNTAIVVEQVPLLETGMVWAEIPLKTKPVCRLPAYGF